MKNQNNNNLMIQAKDAIEHIDRNVADDILRKIAKGEITDSQVLDLKRRLQIVNFPNISKQEVSNIFENNILDFFRIEIPIKDSIEARYVMQGHYEKNNQRKILKKAILQNSEKLGLHAIGQWIQKFDQKYKIEEREESDIVNFILSNNDAQKLADSQKAILKKILYAYDTVLADQVVDIFDLVEIRERLKKRGVINKENNQEDKFRDFYKNEHIGNTATKNNQNRVHLNKVVKIIKIPLSKALEKYPKIREQLLSRRMIKTLGQPYPVKGTIGNWIKDYHSVVGAGNYDIMKRSRYLYNSENAKSLNSEERQKLASLVKALDENFLVTVNPEKEEIIFEIEKNDQRKKMQHSNNAINDNYTKRSQNISNEQSSFGRIKKDNTKTVGSGKNNSIKFSSAQQLPVEKIKKTKKISQNTQSRQTMVERISYRPNFNNREK